MTRQFRLPKQLVSQNEHDNPDEEYRNRSHALRTESKLPLRDSKPGGEKQAHSQREDPPLISGKALGKRSPAGSGKQEKVKRQVYNDRIAFPDPD